MYKNVHVHDGTLIIYSSVVASVIGGGWFDNKISVGNSRCHSRYAVTDTAVAYPADPLTSSSKLYADCGHTYVLRYSTTCTVVPEILFSVTRQGDEVTTK